VEAEENLKDSRDMKKVNWHLGHDSLWNYHGDGLDVRAMEEVEVMGCAEGDDHDLVEEELLIHELIDQTLGASAHHVAPVHDCCSVHLGIGRNRTYSRRRDEN